VPLHLLQPLELVRDAAAVLDGDVRGDGGAARGDAAHVAALFVGVVVRRAAVVMRVFPLVWWCGSGPRVELELEAVFVVGVAPPVAQ
jgi:hypothetical protein